MIEYKIDRACDGQDVFFDGKKVGWLSFGDLRSLHEDRRPVTMLVMDRGTKHHDNMGAAKAYIEATYQQYTKKVDNMNAEQKAFARVYERNEGVAYMEEIEEFFKEIAQAEPEVQIEVYKWDSIQLAWNIWQEARRYKEVTA